MDFLQAHHLLFKRLITNGILGVDSNHLKILNNISITTYGSRAWAFTIQEIGKRKGEDYLYNLGYDMGKNAASEVKEINLEMKKYIPEIFQDPESVLQMLGFGIIKLEQDGNVFRLSVVKNHILEFAYDFYNTESTVHVFYAGIYSGFVDSFLGVDSKIQLDESQIITRQNTQYKTRL